MTKYREINLIEVNLKDLLFEFKNFSKIITKNDNKKNNEIIERILQLRNFAKKIVDLLDEMYVKELKGGNNG